MVYSSLIVQYRERISSPLYRWREEAGFVQKLSAALLFALLTALAAQFRFHIPFSPVPFTGQVLIVLIAPMVIGRYGAISQLMYIGMGASFGWFSGMVGMAALTGITAGYLVGFVIAAAFLGEMVERKMSWSFSEMLAGLSAAAFIIYVPGVVWLSILLGIGIGEAVVIGLLPFLIVDAIKVIAAAGISAAFLRPTA